MASHHSKQAQVQMEITKNVTHQVEKKDVGHGSHSSVLDEGEDDEKISEEREEEDKKVHRNDKVFPRKGRETDGSWGWLWSGPCPNLGEVGNHILAHAT